MLLLGVLFLIGWTSLFLCVEVLVKGKSTEIVDTKNRIISIVHGQVSFILAFKYLLNNGLNFCDKTTDNERYVVLASLTYFIYDFTACVVYNIYDTSLVLHHSASIIGFTVAYFAEYGASNSILGLFLAEASNLPMHLRVILRSHNMRHTLLYEYSELAYLVIYIISRGLLVPFNFYWAFTCDKTPIVVWGMCGFLMVQSWVFISRMAGILRKKQKEWKEREEKNVELYWLTVNEEVSKLEYFNKHGKQNIF